MIKIERSEDEALSQTATGVDRRLRALSRMIARGSMKPADWTEYHLLMEKRRRSMTRRGLRPGGQFAAMNSLRRREFA